MTNTKTKARLLLCVNLVIYSFSGVCLKKAGAYPDFSFYFFLFYALAFLVLALYALLWQRVLKSLPLSEAFSGKAVTVVLGMLWGFLFFGERITFNMIIGCAVIIAGVLIVVLSEESGDRI